MAKYRYGRKDTKSKPTLGFVEPELAHLVDAVPEGDEWLHELKLDGYRMQAQLDKTVLMFSRNNKEWTENFPEIVEELAAFKSKGTILDGEVVYLVNGRSNFQRLQNSIKFSQNAPLYFYVFDALFLEGKDLRALPLIERKELLKKYLSKRKTKYVRYNEHVLGEGEELFKMACENKLEGIISKLADSLYSSGRSRDWVKVKCQNQQEFVVCGYTESDKGSPFRSLILGVHRNGKLSYAGKVGGGFTQKSLNEIAGLIFKLETKKCPFAIKPDEKNVHWLKPKYLAQVKFAEWTDEGVVRQPIFLGMRSDKAVKNITVDSPEHINQATHL
ncbi:non-homologous end-joining DNA ligase [Bdellovibrio sp. HCB185ZH]|uniref:non-homologous end-joining DNA ligase n=1 Tax=Bdellovibrio sp. HCB185ZH TaxID=3394235 RepID=UPI0039A7692A